MEGFSADDATQCFTSAWTKLAAEEELICTSTGAHLAPLPKPSAVIVDVRRTDCVL